MLKWMAFLGLGALLLLNSSLKLAEVLNYFEHREAIAAVLCVEKDVPGSCCAGSCHVAARTTALDGTAGSMPMESTPVQRAVEQPFVAEPKRVLTPWGWSRLVRLARLWASPVAIRG